MQGLSNMSFSAPGTGMERMPQAVGPGSWGSPGGGVTLAHLGLGNLPGGSGVTLNRNGPDGHAASPSQSTPMQVGRHLCRQCNVAVAILYAVDCLYKGG